MLNEV